MRMMTILTKETTHLISGPAGQLELIRGEPLVEERAAWGVVCHPHPLYGGTMHNKVVTTLAKTFQGMGVPTIRFNFRGVMRSEGAYGHGDGELEDLLAVIQWLQAERSKPELWLGGFSFGGYIAARAASQLPVTKLVTIAPPVRHFPMHTLTPIAHPWVLVQGERDDVVPPEDVLNWAQSCNPQPIIIRFPEAGHYFHGQLGELRYEIESALKSE